MRLHGVSRPETAETTGPQNCSDHGTVKVANGRMSYGIGMHTAKGYPSVLVRAQKLSSLWRCTGYAKDLAAARFCPISKVLGSADGYKIVLRFVIMTKGQSNALSGRCEQVLGGVSQSQARPGHLVKSPVSAKPLRKPYRSKDSVSVLKSQSLKSQRLSFSTKANFGPSP